MKSLLLAMLVGLLMVGCGEEAQEEAVQEEAKREQLRIRDTKAAYAKLGDSFTVPDLGLEMIWVKPGTFMMGSPESEADRYYHIVQHEVTLTKGFYLGKYEVTQAQWAKIMGSNPSSFKGADRPVESVSWTEAVEFCTKLTDMEKKAGRVPEGMAYQLPTEAQWEYACRAGTTMEYSWGDTIDSSNANYNASGIKQTRDVGQYAANPWGFHDMYGNVYEWCADWYGTYPSGFASNPEGPASGLYRVLRGGSWHRDWKYLRSAMRFIYIPGNRRNGLGFRVGFLPGK